MQICMLNDLLEFFTLTFGAHSAIERHADLHGQKVKLDFSTLTLGRTVPLNVMQIRMIECPARVLHSNVVGAQFLHAVFGAHGMSSESSSL